MAVTIPLIVIGCVAIALWAWQIRIPRTVAWRPHFHDGHACEIAPGLVLQHQDGDVVWAAQGYGIYRSVDGGPFHRVAVLRPPFGEAWGGYLRALRRRFGYQELVEVLPLGGEELLAFAGGHAFRLDLSSGSCERTFALRYFGRGKGRGLMAFGITRDDSGAVYVAEYVTESGDRPVGIWKSVDDGRTWTLVYEFAAGQTRHVHAVQYDPIGGGLWIGTGDRDEHCFVGCSTDGGTSFRWITRGNQQARTCSFAFFDDCVLWGMDADFVPNHVIRWARGDENVTAGAPMPDATYYAQRIDRSRALLGVAQGVGEVRVARSDATAVPWLAWEVPAEPPARGPSPGIRLARGDATGPFVYVNPLRTTDHEAVILRIPREEVPA